MGLKQNNNYQAQMKLRGKLDEEKKRMSAIERQHPGKINQVLQKIRSRIDRTNKYGLKLNVMKNQETQSNYQSIGRDREEKSTAEKHKETDLDLTTSLDDEANRSFQHFTLQQLNSLLDNDSFNYSFNEREEMATLYKN